MPPWEVAMASTMEARDRGPCRVQCVPANPLKWLWQPVDGRCWHDRAGVGHRQDNSASLGGGQDVDAAVVEVVAQCVVDQVDDQTLDKVWIAGHWGERERRVSGHTPIIEFFLVGRAAVPLHQDQRCESRSKPAARNSRKRQHCGYVKLALGGNLVHSFGDCFDRPGRSCLGILKPPALALGFDDPAAVGEGG